MASRYPKTINLPDGRTLTAVELFKPLKKEPPIELVRLKGQMQLLKWFAIALFVVIGFFITNWILSKYVFKLPGDVLMTETNNFSSIIFTPLLSTVTLLIGYVFGEKRRSSGEDQEGEGGL